MTRNGVARPKIVVFGIAFWYPLAGVTWQFLHYLIGLRRLGYDPYYVEDSGRWVYDPDLNDLTPDAEGNVHAVAPVLEAHGFAGRWAFRGCYPDGRCYGLSEPQILDLYGEAEAFLNVTGAQEIRDEHLACPRRIYIESDPFRFQVRAVNGEKPILQAIAAHDTFFSFGENIGADDCIVPLAGVRWRATRQPVAVDLWEGSRPERDVYTTITTWKNTGKDIEFGGETYHWTKDREFLPFIDLPQRTPVPLELAVNASDRVRDLLTRNGWRQTGALAVSRDPDAYRGYIRGSRAEFTVARDQYVRPNTGWFSDRSACYLAAGRPVVTQETGFSKFLPTGRGLFGFRTLDDVLAALEAIESDYDVHAAAAQEVAQEYFATEKVVGRLMAEAGLGLG